MKRLVASLANHKQMQVDLIIEFFKALNNLLFLDLDNNVYNERMGPGYGSVKLTFDECGGTEVLEKVQFH